LLAGALALLGAAAAGGCGTAVHRPAAGAGFELDPDYEITDADVRRAFEATPQMKPPLRVAYLSFDPARSEPIGAALRKVEGISDVYELPPFLITGQRRYERMPHWTPRPKAPSIKKMRLMAARAHCDVLLVFDYGHRVRTSGNWLSAFNVLLLPALFVPFIDEEVDTYLDTYVMDVRNGYLYAHVESSEHEASDYHTIYSGWSKAAVERAWATTLADTTRELSKVVASSKAGVAPAAGDTPAAPAPAPAAPTPPAAAPAEAPAAAPGAP